MDHNFANGNTNTRGTMQNTEGDNTLNSSAELRGIWPNRQLHRAYEPEFEHDSQGDSLATGGESSQLSSPPVNPPSASYTPVSNILQHSPNSALVTNASVYPNPSESLLMDPCERVRRVESDVTEHKVDLVDHLIDAYRGEYSPGEKNGRNRSENNISRTLINNTNGWDQSTSVSAQPQRHYREGVFHLLRSFPEEDFKWKIVKTIDDGLLERDIMQLKFLCSDFIPSGELEKMDRGYQIVNFLEKTQRLSNNNVAILVELLYRIGRFDLLKTLVLDSDQYKRSIVKTDCILSAYRTLLHDIAEDTTDAELNQMKFYLTSQFKRAVLETLTEPQHLFTQMEKKELLGESNMDLLIKMLKQVHKNNLVRRILEYQGVHTPRNPLLHDEWERAGRPYLLPAETGVRHIHLPSTKSPSANQYRSGNKTSASNVPFTGVSSPGIIAGFDGNALDKIDQFMKNQMNNQHHGQANAREHTLFYQDKTLKMTSLDSPDSYDRHRNETEHLNPYQVINAAQRNLPEYKMNAKPRGICVIINNTAFDKGDANVRAKLKRREGSDVDKDNLETIFKDLHFRVDVHDNLTSVEMVRRLSKYGLDYDHSAYDCFVCCILTHGRKDKVYGTDGELVDIAEFTNCFKGIRCSTLRGKPKLFFIQACQGKSRQPGVSAQPDNDPNDPYRRHDLETDDDSVTLDSMESLPNEADFLLSLATLPGFVSYRSKSHGSWFVNALVASLRQYHDREDLVSILAKVNYEVSTMDAPIDEDIFKQIPQPKFTLRKKLFFR